MSVQIRSAVGEQGVGETCCQGLTSMLRPTGWLKGKGHGGGFGRTLWAEGMTEAPREHFPALKAVQRDLGLEGKGKSLPSESGEGHWIFKCLEKIPGVRTLLPGQGDAAEEFLNQWDFYLVSDSVYVGSISIFQMGQLRPRRTH